MSLAALVTQAVGTAFDIIDDLSPAGTITRYSDTGYDATTGDVNRTSVTHDVNQIIPTRFKAKEIDSSVNVATDSKFIIHSPDLPFEPQNDDMVAFDGGEWNVKKLMGVPGKSIWILHVRKH